MGGPKGIKGHEGPPGTVGPKGVKGLKGIKGAAGMKGVKGPAAAAVMAAFTAEEEKLLNYSQHNELSALPGLSAGSAIIGLISIVVASLYCHQRRKYLRLGHPGADTHQSHSHTRKDSSSIV